MTKVTNPHDFLCRPQPCSLVPSEEYDKAPDEKYTMGLALKSNTVSGALG